MRKASAKLIPQQIITLTSDEQSTLLHVMATQIDDFSVVFFVVTLPSYPAHSIQKMMQQFSERFLDSFTPPELQQAKDTAQSSGSFQRASQRILQSVLVDFGDPQSLDKTLVVQDQIEHVKAVAEENVRLALTNVESAEELEGKSDLLRSQGERFKASATALRRQMQLRKYKLWCILFLFILAIALYIIVPIATASKAADAVTP
jgi:hypothetical protein